MGYTPTAADVIAARRQLCRSSLLDWCTYAQRLSGQAPAAHHRLLIDRLERLERGETTRLMVLMPPGAAKSTYTSILLPPWWLARNPAHAIIAASHTAELAERFGRRVRNTVAEHRDILGVGIRADNAAAGRWETDRGGEYYAAGVGGSVTGRRADLAIIDDPVRSREDADSERGRETAWQWWRNDLVTRLKPGARVVVIMTRWHMDDIGGRLLADMADGGAPWDVLRLPMEAEHDDPLGRAVGEPLWPEWYTDEMRAEARRDPRTWNALYQQRPAADEGGYFRAEWLPRWDIRPQNLSIYGTSDYAVTDGGGDYTVHRIWGVGPDGTLYRMAGWRGQTSSDVWIEQQLDLAKQWRPACWFGEAGVIAKAIEPMLIRRMRERRIYCRMEWVPSIHDKSTRARGFQARAAMGSVRFEPGSDISEFLAFPAGAHDDEIDCAGLIGRALDMAHPGIVPVVEPKKSKSAWDRSFADDESPDWKTA